MRQYLAVSVACLLVLVATVGSAAPEDMVGFDATAGGNGFAMCDPIGTTCAATAAGVMTACAKASGKFGWIDVSAEACGGFALAGTYAVGLILPDVVVYGASFVEFTAPTPDEEPKTTNPYCNPKLEVCFPAVPASWAVKPPAKPEAKVDRSSCYAARQVPTEILLTMVACGTMAQIARADGCYSAGAEAAARSLFAAKPPSASGNGCAEQDPLFASSMGASRPVAFVDLPVEDQEALEAALRAKVAAWWDATTADWPEAFDPYKADMKAQALASIRDTLMDGEVRVG